MISVTDSAKETVPYEVHLNVDPKRRWWQGLSNIGNWLALLALGVPMFGSLWIVIYAFGTPGPHWSYLGIGMSTAIAAFLSGVSSASSLASHGWSRPASFAMTPASFAVTKDPVCPRRAQICIRRAQISPK